MAENNAIRERRGFACNPEQSFTARFSDDAEQFLSASIVRCRGATAASATCGSITRAGPPARLDFTIAAVAGRRSDAEAPGALALGSVAR